jgi:prepilin-type N-terminal cleavage/methylation domain-containing protein
MRTRQSGFTLVEFMIVALLTAVVLGGVYQTLAVQEKSYEAASLLMRDQESLRTALGILESELREIGSIGGEDIGGTDIADASANSITFRAQRKTGFICKLSRGEKWAIVWTLGDDLEANDKLLVFVDGDSTSFTDDHWDTTTVSSAASDSDSDCSAYWPDPPLQIIRLNNMNMDSVVTGAPIRSYKWVTYALYDFGDQGYGLGRLEEGDEEPDFLVGDLDPTNGLQFTYYTPGGAETTDPTQIARMRITVQTEPEGNSGVDAASMTANLYLRNN